MASVLLVGPAFAGDARAEREFSIEYRAAKGCPAQSEFEAAVVSRVPGARVVSMERARVRFRVTLSDATENTSSTISIELTDGTSSTRSVSNASCADAAESMAVIAAMVLEGQRSAQEVDTTPTLLAERAARSPPSAAEPNQPKPQPATPALAQARNEARVVPHDLGGSEDRRRPNAATVRTGAALSGSWESEVAPVAPLGVLGSLEVRWELASIWSPSLRLGLLYTASASETSVDGVGTFRLLTGRASLCPVRLAHVRAFRLFACADVDVGQLHGEGSQTLNERTQNMLWLAAGPAVRGEVPLGSMWALEGLFGVRGLANHDRFVFAGGAIVHDVAPVSVGVGIGVSARLP
jgi:hypothetical protein